MATIPLRGATGFNAVEDKGTYDRILLDRAVPQFVHGKFGMKKSIPARGGTWVEWRRVEYITASTTAVTEGTVTTEFVPTVTKTVGTVAQYAQFMRGTDLVDEQSYDPLLAEFTEALGDTMADSIDQLTRNVLVADGTVQYASTATTRATVGSGMRMTSAELREAVATLETNNAKTINGVFPAIIHTRVKYDLFGDSNIVNAFQYAADRGGNNPLLTGTLGQYMGIEFYPTSNAKIQASLGLSGADVYVTMLFGKDSYGVLDLSMESARTYFKPKGSGGATGDPVDQVWSLGYKFAHACAVLNSTWYVRIEHTAALGTGG